MNPNRPNDAHISQIRPNSDRTPQSYKTPKQERSKSNVRISLARRAIKTHGPSQTKQPVKPQSLPSPAEQRSIIKDFFNPFLSPHHAEPNPRLYSYQSTPKRVPTLSSKIPPTQPSTHCLYCSSAYQSLAQPGQDEIEEVCFINLNMASLRALQAALRSFLENDAGIKRGAFSPEDIRRHLKQYSSIPLSLYDRWFRSAPRDDTVAKETADVQMYTQGKSLYDRRKRTISTPLYSTEQLSLPSMEQPVGVIGSAASSHLHHADKRPRYAHAGQRQDKIRYQTRAKPKSCPGLPPYSENHCNVCLDKALDLANSFHFWSHRQSDAFSISDTLHALSIQCLLDTLAEYDSMQCNTPILLMEQATRHSASPTQHHALRVDHDHFEAAILLEALPLQWKPSSLASTPHTADTLNRLSTLQAQAHHTQPQQDSNATNAPHSIYKAQLLDLLDMVTFQDVLLPHISLDTLPPSSSLFYHHFDSSAKWLHHLTTEFTQIHHMWAESRQLQRRGIFYQPADNALDEHTIKYISGLFELQSLQHYERVRELDIPIHRDQPPPNSIQACELTCEELVTIRMHRSTSAATIAYLHSLSLLEVFNTTVSRGTKPADHNDLTQLHFSALNPSFHQYLCLQSQTIPIYSVSVGHGQGAHGANILQQYLRLFQARPYPPLLKSLIHSPSPFHLYSADLIPFPSLSMQKSSTSSLTRHGRGGDDVLSQGIQSGSSKRTLNEMLKKLYTLAIMSLDLPPLFATFTKEKSDDGKRNYATTLLSSFLHRYHSILKQSKQYYEIIRKGRPCPIYLDLEFPLQHYIYIARDLGLMHDNALNSATKEQNKSSSQQRQHEPGSSYDDDGDGDLEGDLPVVPSIDKDRPLYDPIVGNLLDQLSYTQYITLTIWLTENYRSLGIIPGVSVATDAAGSEGATLVLIAEANTYHDLITRHAKMIQYLNDSTSLPGGDWGVPDELLIDHHYRATEHSKRHHVSRPSLALFPTLSKETIKLCLIVNMIGCLGPSAKPSSSAVPPHTPSYHTNFMVSVAQLPHHLQFNIPKPINAHRNGLRSRRILLCCIFIHLHRHFPTLFFTGSGSSLPQNQPMASPNITPILVFDPSFSLHDVSEIYSSRQKPRWHKIKQMRGKDKFSRHITIHMNGQRPWVVNNDQDGVSDGNLSPGKTDCGLRVDPTAATQDELITDDTLERSEVYVPLPATFSDTDHLKYFMDTLYRDIQTACSNNTPFHHQIPLIQCDESTGDGSHPVEASEATSGMNKEQAGDNSISHPPQCPLNHTHAIPPSVLRELFFDTPDTASWDDFTPTSLVGSDLQATRRKQDKQQETTDIDTAQQHTQEQTPLQLTLGHFTYNLVFAPAAHHESWDSSFNHVIPPHLEQELLNHTESLKRQFNLPTLPPPKLYNAPQIQGRTFLADLQVYTKNRTFRMLYSSKMKDDFLVSFSPSSGFTAEKLSTWVPYGSQLNPTNSGALHTEQPRMDAARADPTRAFDLFMHAITNLITSETLRSRDLMPGNAGSSISHLTAMLLHHQRLGIKDDRGMNDVAVQSLLRCLSRSDPLDCNLAFILIALRTLLCTSLLGYMLPLPIPRQEEDQYVNRFTEAPSTEGLPPQHSTSTPQRLPKHQLPQRSRPVLHDSPFDKKKNGHSSEEGSLSILHPAHHNARLIMASMCSGPSALSSMVLEFPHLSNTLQSASTLRWIQPPLASAGAQYPFLMQPTEVKYDVQTTSHDTKQNSREETQTAQQQAPFASLSYYSYESNHNAKTGDPFNLTHAFPCLPIRVFSQFPSPCPSHRWSSSHSSADHSLPVSHSLRTLHNELSGTPHGALYHDIVDGRRFPFPSHILGTSGAPETASHPLRLGYRARVVPHEDSPSHPLVVLFVELIHHLSSALSHPQQKSLFSHYLTTPVSLLIPASTISHVNGGTATTKTATWELTSTDLLSIFCDLVNLQVHATYFTTACSSTIAAHPDVNTAPRGNLLKPPQPQASTDASYDLLARAETALEPTPFHHHAEYFFPQISPFISTWCPFILTLGNARESDMLSPSGCMAYPSHTRFSLASVYLIRYEWQVSISQWISSAFAGLMRKTSATSISPDLNKPSAAMPRGKAVGTITLHKSSSFPSCFPFIDIRLMIHLFWELGRFSLQAANDLSPHDIYQLSNRRIQLQSWKLSLVPTEFKYIYNGQEYIRIFHQKSQTSTSMPTTAPHSPFPSYDLVIEYTIANAVCHTRGRPHRSNAVRRRVNLTSGRVSDEGCYDMDCRPQSSTRPGLPPRSEIERPMWNLLRFHYYYGPSQHTIDDDQPVE